MKRVIALAALLAAGTASAQTIPAMQVAENSNVCGNGTLVRASYTGENQITAVCRDADGALLFPGGGATFGGLSGAAVAGGVGLLAVVFALANDDDDDGSITEGAVISTNGTNGTNGTN